MRTQYFISIFLIFLLAACNTSETSISAGEHSSETQIDHIIHYKQTVEMESMAFGNSNATSSAAYSCESIQYDKDKRIVGSEFTFDKGKDNTWCTKDDNKQLATPDIETIRWPPTTVKTSRVYDEEKNQGTEFRYDRDGMIISCTEFSWEAANPNHITSKKTYKTTKLTTTADIACTELSLYETAKTAYSYTNDLPVLDVMHIEQAGSLEMNFRIVRHYDVNNVAYLKQVFNGPGPDNVWGTDDDQLSTYTETVSNKLGLILEQRHYHAGADSVRNTGDDSQYQLHVYVRDIENNLQQSIVYDGPGKDGSWSSTEDNRIRAKVFYR